MKITDIRATTVTVPLEAPIRHSAGAHWGRFVRTIVEVETDEGIWVVPSHRAVWIPGGVVHSVAMSTVIHTPREAS